MSKLIINDREWFSKPCADATDGAENLTIIKEMNEVLDANKGGVGLAANQIGYNKRIAIIKTRIDEDIVLVNPEIISVSKKTVKSVEGCLSFPGVEVTTKRHRTITLRRQPGFIEETFTGFDAIVIQHELSHLNGDTMWDYEYKNVGNKFTPKKKKRSKKRR